MSSGGVADEEEKTDQPWQTNTRKKFLEAHGNMKTKIEEKHSFRRRPAQKNTFCKGRPDSCTRTMPKKVGEKEGKTSREQDL